jgi:hypothetical protein
MEAEAILAQAKAGPDYPRGWIVLPLLRHKVILSILGWAFGIILGLGLFLIVAPIVIPSNYEHGPMGAIITTVLLGILLFIGIGSLVSLISDLSRLREAKNHIIVITPEDFVKQQGPKITHVPLVYVRHVTTRGVPPPDHSPDGKQGVGDMPSARENTMGFLLGRGLIPSGERWKRKRMRAPTSLAFLDSRTNSEVVVVTDGSHGDLFTIAAYLREYASQNAIR